MTGYTKPVGRYAQFPVSLVTTISENGLLKRLIGEHSTAHLSTGIKLDLTKDEAEKLARHLERWEQIQQLNAVISAHRQAMQQR